VTRVRYLRRSNDIMVSISWRFSNLPWLHCFSARWRSGQTPTGATAVVSLWSARERVVDALGQHVVGGYLCSEVPCHRRIYP